MSAAHLSITPAATDWLTVEAGEFHTCALKKNSTLWCWGDNYDGELGDGTAWKTSPVKVQFP